VQRGRLAVSVGWLFYASSAPIPEPMEAEVKMVLLPLSCTQPLASSGVTGTVLFVDEEF